MLGDARGEAVGDRRLAHRRPVLDAVPGQTVESIVSDIRRALDPLMLEDPELKYDIEIPPPESIKGRRRLVMDPLDVPKDEYIVQSVARNFEEHMGRPPTTIGALLPRSYAGNDTCHLWAAGIPCVLNGPGGDRTLNDEPDNFVYISQMVQCAKTHALTALDVCSQPS
ncbi:MAG: hypothetical protein IH955_10840 [Chloroflexi bacterium]|nr:hypothetical protein [Chloroflexota bacterium]